MKNLFANKKDLEAAQARIAELEAIIAQSKKLTAESDPDKKEEDEMEKDEDEEDDLETKLQGVIDAVKTLGEKVDQIETKVATLAEKYEDEDEDEESEKEEEDEDEKSKAKAHKAAVALLAASGHEAPIAVQGEGSQLSIREQYSKLSTPSERAAFRAKHWDKLTNQ